MVVPPQEPDKPPANVATTLPIRNKGQLYFQRPFFICFLGKIKINEKLAILNYYSTKQFYWVVIKSVFISENMFLGEKMADNTNLC